MTRMPHIANKEFSVLSGKPIYTIHRLYSNKATRIPKGLDVLNLNQNFNKQSNKIASVSR